ncbi:hypothetical protein KAR26_01035 [Candidatus Parcubacteria bacterium]|nr:hypothetical protein [Candidatus Parcubacteria bacterium]
MKIIVCRDENVAEAGGYTGYPKSLVIVISKETEGKERKMESGVRLEKQKLTAEKIAKRLSFLNNNVLLDISRILNQEMRRRKDSEEEAADISGEMTSVRDWSLRTKNRYAGVLHLDSQVDWSEVQKTLKLDPGHLAVGPEQIMDAIRAVIAKELELPEESNWQIIAKKLGLPEKPYVYKIIDTLRVKRAKDLGLRRTSTWKSINKKRKALIETKKTKNKKK